MAPFNVACANADLDSVKALLKHGVDPNVPDEIGHLPLVSAVLSGSQPTVGYLLERDADPTSRFLGRTAIDYARDANDWALIQMLESKVRKSI